MLSSITPVGESARGQRWIVTAAAHVMGAVTGGVVLGTVLGSVGFLTAWVVASRSGPVPASVLLALVGVAAAFGALADKGIVPIARPTLHRQVDERWLDTYRGWVYGGGYGFQLGLGVATVIPTWATFATMAAMAASTSPALGGVIGGVFGLARGVPVLLTWRFREPGTLWRFHERFDERQSAGHQFAVAGQLTVALAAFGLLAGGLA